MSFNFWHEYYNYPVGVAIRGSIGNNYTYRVKKKIQEKYLYNVPPDPKTPAQLRMRDLIRKATGSWHDLSSAEKKWYDDNVPSGKTWSGFNYFVSVYIRSYI